jgi:signal transduction histidine kinase
MLIEGQRLTTLINNVLDLEKIEAGEMVWNIEAVDVADVVSQAAAATESLYRQKALDFSLDVAGDLPLVLGDRDRLVQVIVNLISNAVKFTKEGSVRCRACVDSGGRVRVEVTDTGSGIAPADQAAVFEKFRQVGDTLTDKPAGTGLGLPICKEIVEHLGGSIALESMPGRGSTFHFTLPVAAERRGTEAAIGG